MTTAATQKDLFRKAFGSIQIKDADKGLVECVFATIGVKDHDGDYTLPGAFEAGAEVIISAYGHRSWMGALPVGHGVIRVEKNQAIMDGEFFIDTPNGAETFGVIKRLGKKQEWSYGFDVLETGELTEDLRQKGVWRVLQKLKVYEVSPVLVGAGVDTMTLSAKAKGTEPAQHPPAISIEARRLFKQHLETRKRLRGLGLW